MIENPTLEVFFKKLWKRKISQLGGLAMLVADHSNKNKNALFTDLNAVWLCDV